MSTALESSLLKLCRDLVRTPSQGGIDAPAPIIAVLQAWLDRNKVPYIELKGRSSKVVALAIELFEDRSIAPIVFNACLDTAPVGRRNDWEHEPFGATVKDGWLIGRGSADSKAGVSVLAHIARELCHRPVAVKHQPITILFDADEHTGKFGGIKAYTRAVREIRGVYILYPGDDRIIRGSRGFLRGTLSFRGQTSHSGARTRLKSVATTAAAHFVEALAAWDRALAKSPGEISPRATVTWISSGVSTFTAIPSTVMIGVDVRLTGRLARTAAEAAILEIVSAIQGSVEVLVKWRESWPPYEIAPNDRLVTALRKSIADSGLQPVSSAISGPSNIGNYLSTLGIPVVAGYGVRYEGIHQPDERIEIGSLRTTFDVYRNIVRTFLSVPSK